MSDVQKLIRNVSHGQVFDVKEQVSFDSGMVNSLSLAQQPNVKMTLFAIDEGEGMSSHAAGGDALAFVLEGTALITLDGMPHTIEAGQALVMPCGAPHSVLGITPFKMLLVVVKP